MSAEAAPYEYVFHWEGGGPEWSHLRVVSFHVRDAISEPYEAKLVLHAHGQDHEVDPEALVGALATLRITTLADPAVRCVHGLIAEAAEIGSTRFGMLYEVLLVPPVMRAMHRARSRVFLEKTTKEILEAVLTGDPKMKVEDPDLEVPGSLTDAFKPPKECLAFRLQDPSRVEDAATRPYCVQYNESDLAFVLRLLAEEGIAVHFEHHAEAVVMVLSDSDSGRTKLDPFDPIGPGQPGRQLDHVRLGKRLRASRFRLVDFNWQKPALDMKVEAKVDGDENLGIDAYPGLYPDEPKQGELLAKARLERLQTEARFAEVATTCRLVGAGSIFAMTHGTSRYEGEYLVAKAELFGHVPGELAGGELVPALRRSDDRPFVAKLECVRRGTADSPDESKYRPPLQPKPRVIGSQTAIVTAEPSNKDVEIHVGGPEGNENGCVRLKFHWDLETDRHDKEPTSCWVRVSQAFAGAGGGALCHPRVGTEVIVEYIDGDPDRPIVVGRVYNGQQPPPAKAKGAATVTTLKSMSSPGGKVSNELSFDDTAGEEKVSLNAGKDWNSTVGNNRTETIQNDSKSSVMANRNEDTTSDRTTTVGGNNSESVSGDEKVNVGGSQGVSVGGDQKESVGGSQTIGVGADRSLSVGASQTISVSASNSVNVGAAETYTVGAAQDVTVGAAKTEVIGAAYDLTVAAAMTVTAGAPHTRNAPVDTTNAPTHAINSVTTAINAAAKAAVQSALIELMASGVLTLQGATVAVSGSGEVTISGPSVSIKGDSISIEGGSVKIAGGTTDITGGVVKVN
jgi:type VI secretion system secreted protein VgrG